MVEQLKTFDNNVLAFTIIDGLSNVDEQYIQKLFNNKIDVGYEQINILVKLDEYKFSKNKEKGRHERYFYISEMDEAMAFVNPE
ncbi:MAG: hypothetical protein PSN34_10780 [Urechidicola sp.]|nr:hypothetical protein [Urechidicola sp.]